MKKNNILMKIVIVGFFGGSLFVLNGSNAMLNSNDYTKSVSNNLIQITKTDTKIGDINKKDLVINGKYIGNGIINVDGKKIKIISSHLKKIKNGDNIKLIIKGNINSFTIKDLIVNGKSFYNNIKSISHKGWETKYKGYGIFDLEGTLKNGFLYINDNGKERKIRILSKKSETLNNSYVKVKIKGTLKDFKILSIKKEL